MASNQGLKVLNDEPPLVTVYIPTRNRSRLVVSAVESVLNQSYRNIEIIVVNDASTDQTMTALESLAALDSRIVCFHQTSPQGACAARNIAISAANGYFITGLDDDDTFLANRVQILVDSYSDHYAFVFTKDNGHTFGSYSIERQYDDLLWENIVGNQILCKTTELKKIGGFDPTLDAAQDYDVWLRLSNGKKFLQVNKKMQLISTDESLPRITTSNRKFQGNYACFKKNRHRFNRNQRKYHLYKLNQLAKKGTKPTLRDLMLWYSLVPLKFKVKRFAVLARSFLRYCVGDAFKKYRNSNNSSTNC